MAITNIDTSLQVTGVSIRRKFSGVSSTTNWLWLISHRIWSLGSTFLSCHIFLIYLLSVFSNIPEEKNEKLKIHKNQSDVLLQLEKIYIFVCFSGTAVRHLISFI